MKIKNKKTKARFRRRTFHEPNQEVAELNSN